MRAPRQTRRGLASASGNGRRCFTRTRNTTDWSRAPAASWSDKADEGGDPAPLNEDRGRTRYATCCTCACVITTPNTAGGLASGRARRAGAANLASARKSLARNRKSCTGVAATKGTRAQAAARAACCETESAAPGFGAAVSPCALGNDPSLCWDCWRAPQVSINSIYFKSDRL